MSDHPKEAKRTLKRIRICDDSCFDVFDWLPPKKVGLEVAAVSDRFDFLVDTHFEHYRKWALGELEIRSDGIVKINANGPNETLPFPKVPLPNSVAGFVRVLIRAFNSDAIAFLRRIGRLLQSNISLEFFASYGDKNWDAFATSVLPLISLSGIIKIHFGWPYEFHDFRRVTSPTILRDCGNLRFITLLNDDKSLQFPPNDSDGSSAGRALCHWLHTPRADGRPKVLQNCAQDVFPMEQLKTHFLNATTPINFIIICRPSRFFVQFELINSLTHEQMTCRRIGICWTLIVRCPIGRNEKQWAEWEEEALEYDWENNCKAIRIC